MNYRINKSKKISEFSFELDGFFYTILINHLAKDDKQPDRIKDIHKLICDVDNKIKAGGITGFMVIREIIHFYSDGEKLQGLYGNKNLRLKKITK